MSENADKLDGGGDGAPHMAAYMGDMDFIVAFLKAGAPIEYCNSDGCNLLHAAADGWQSRMAEFLIIYGVNINAQDKNGDTPLHTLVRSRVNPFKGMGIDGSISENDREATFRSLLLRGINVRIKNVQGANALHLAAYEGDLEAVKILALSSYRWIDEVTTKGATALALAILYEHPECARHLIKSGADLNFKLPSGMRLLDVLEASENPGLRRLYDNR